MAPSFCIFVRLEAWLDLIASFIVQGWKIANLNVQEMERDVKIYYTAKINHIFKGYLMFWEGA